MSKLRGRSYLADTAHIDAQEALGVEAGCTVKRDREAGVFEVFHGETCIFRALFTGHNDCWIVRAMYAPGGEEEEQAAVPPAAARRNRKKVVQDVVHHGAQPGQKGRKE